MTKPTLTVCALQLLPALWGKSKIHLTLAAVLMPFALRAFKILGCGRCPLGSGLTGKAGLVAKLVWRVMTPGRSSATNFGQNGASGTAAGQRVGVNLLAYTAGQSRCPTSPASTVFSDTSANLGSAHEILPWSLQAPCEA
jgi:hypothetical protein